MTIPSVFSLWHSSASPLSLWTASRYHWCSSPQYFISLCLKMLPHLELQSPIFILCAVPITAAYWWVQHFYRCSSRELQVKLWRLFTNRSIYFIWMFKKTVDSFLTQRLDSLSRAPVFSHFSDTLTGLVTIRSFRSALSYHIRWSDLEFVATAAASGCVKFLWAV